MWVKLLGGLVALFALYLLIRSLFRNDKSPKAIERAFNEVFDKSDYRNSKNNWLLVSKMETAGWSSKLFVNGFNLWGMKKARKRPNTQQATTWGVPGRDTGISVTGVLSEITGQSEWAKYANLNDAVTDIILWMDYTKFPKEKLSIRDHVEEMKKRSYFVGEDVQEYLGKVLAWEKRNVT